MGDEIMVTITGDEVEVIKAKPVECLVRYRASVTFISSPSPRHHYLVTLTSSPLHHLHPRRLLQELQHGRGLVERFLVLVFEP